MRQISVAALAKLAQKKGTEPLNIVEIDWGVDGQPSVYADRAIGSIPGKILDLGTLDNVVDISSSASQQINLVLDDTDGSMKAIMDSQDIHQRFVRIYQWFEGLSLSDKFLVFSGRISSPISWNEQSRTLSFSVVNQLEDKEFGFSAEEGQFPYVPRTLVGKPWPVIFGKCLDVPALRINQALSGSTLCGVGILSGEDQQRAVSLGGSDCALGQSLAVMSANVSFLNICATAWQHADPLQTSNLIDQANQIRQQMVTAISRRNEQRQCATNARDAKLENAKNNLGCNPLRILGGEDFPQGQHLALSIGSGVFEGYMNNDLFTITNRYHRANEEKAETIASGILSSQCQTPTPAVPYHFEMAVPPGNGDFLNNSVVQRRGLVICTQNHYSRPSAQQVAQYYFAEAGTKVTLYGDEPTYFIVSITPGTVLAVKAFKSLDGVRKLVNVPNDLWHVETKNYGTITATMVVTSKPLSSIEGQGWEDDIYVTYESTIGPNTVDILEYIIDNWTDLDYDTTSFNAVKAKIDDFPSNFPVLTRKNTINLLREIAFQARCAIWISDRTFYLKYLPEEPSSDANVTVSDVTDIEVSTTSTEDLVTKMVVEWHLSWAEEPNKIILRHNVSKYGTIEEEHDWYIYNQPDIVLKAATFWLIRKSNTWKKMKFQGYLNLLNLEVYDTVNIQVPNAIASGDVKAIVEKADYDSLSNTINFEVLTPVKFGTNVQYQFFWPKTITANFPTTNEINNNLAGGGGIGADASGELPIGFTDGLGDGGTVFVGGPNVLFRSQSDRGDRTPGDTGFSAQEILPTSVYADLDSVQNPDPDLSLNYIDPLPPLPLVSQQAGQLVIDIRKTIITDSDYGTDSILATVFRNITDGALVVDTGALFGDDSNTAEYFFKYSDDDGQFVAGAAYLKE